MTDVRDFDRAAAALEHFDQAAGDVVAPTLRTAGSTVQRAVRAAARSHRKTGALEANVATTVSGRGLATTVRVHAGGPVAHLITGGTAPHEISPTRGQALAMTAPGGAGGPIGFASSVRHPGTRPDPFVARGVDAARGDVDQLIDQAAATLARELAHAMEG